MEFMIQQKNCFRKIHNWNPNFDVFDKIMVFRAKPNAYKCEDGQNFKKFKAIRGHASKISLQ